MADEDAKSNDRSVSTLVEAGKKSKKARSKKRSNRNKIDYRVMVRCFIKFLTRVLKVCQENKIRHTDIASNVIPALLDVILHCKWSKVSPIYIEQIVTLLGHLSVVSEKETEWVVRDLIAVVKSPWRRPLITSMLHGVQDLKIEEVFDLLAKEGLLVVNRVRSLLENKLAKLCLNYLTWVYRCFTWDKRPIQNTISLPNKQFIFDIYIILSIDLKGIRDVFNVLKSFSNDEIMLMVDRLRAEHNRSDIALQVVNVLILKMSINVLETNEYILYSRLVKIFCEMLMTTKRNVSETYNRIADLKKQLNSVCKLTATSDHIYAIAQELFKQFSTNREVITFVIELYIRGLTTDANALDKAKCVSKEPETVRELGKKLSRVFQEVASIFPEYEPRREFILNAFCVNPCMETFKVLESIANDAPQPPPKQPLSSLPDDCTWHSLKKSGTHLCFTCGGLFSHDDDNWMEEVQSVYEEPDSTKLLDPQKTSFAPHLCDDLNVVLSSTRIQQLHWNLEHKEMFTRCRNYIEQYKDLKLMLSKELEYLNIDYNQFKDLPSNYADDPYAGVEKGYEHFIEFSEEEEFEDAFQDSNQNRNVGRPKKSDDSQGSRSHSRSKKYDSDDTDDYLPPSSNVGRPRKPVDPNAPKPKLGRPKKIIDESQPNVKIKGEKKRKGVNPSSAPIKSVLKPGKSDLIDLTKDDSSSGVEVSPIDDTQQQKLVLNSKDPPGISSTKPNVRNSDGFLGFPEKKTVLSESGKNLNNIFNLERAFGAAAMQEHYVKLAKLSGADGIQQKKNISNFHSTKPNSVPGVSGYQTKKPIYSETSKNYPTFGFPTITSAQQYPVTSKYNAIIYPKPKTSTVTSASLHCPSMVSTTTPSMSSVTIPGTSSMVTGSTLGPCKESPFTSTASTSLELDVPKISIDILSTSNTLVAPVSSGGILETSCTSMTPLSSGGIRGTSCTSIASVSSCTSIVSSTLSVGIPVSSTLSVGIPVSSNTSTTSSSPSSGILGISSISTATLSSNTNTVKSLRAFRPTTRKQEKTLFSAKLLSSANLSSSSSLQSTSSASLSTFSSNSSYPLTRPVGNLNPGTLAMRYYLVQKYGNIQSNITIGPSQQALGTLASTNLSSTLTTLGSIAQNLCSTSITSTVPSSSSETLNSQNLYNQNTTSTLESTDDGIYKQSDSNPLRMQNLSSKSISQNLKFGSDGNNLSSAYVSSNYNLNSSGSMSHNLSSTSETFRPSISSGSGPSSSGHNLPSTSKTIVETSYQVASTIEDVIRMNTIPSPSTSSSSVDQSKQGTRSLESDRSFHDPQILQNLLSQQVKKQKIDTSVSHSKIENPASSIIMKKRSYARKKSKDLTGTGTKSLQSVISDIRFAQNTTTKNNPTVQTVENQQNQINNDSMAITKNIVDFQQPSSSLKVDEIKNQQTTASQSSQNEVNQMQANDSNQHLSITSASTYIQIETQNQRTNANESTNQSTTNQQNETNVLRNLDSTSTSTKDSNSINNQHILQHNNNNQTLTNVSNSAIAESNQRLIIYQNQTKTNESTSVSNQQFIKKINQIETKINEPTLNKQFLSSSSPMKNQTESKENESLSKQQYLLFDDKDDFEGLDNLQLEKTISEIEANIKQLESFNCEQEKSSTVVDSIVPSTSTTSVVNEVKNDQQMKSVIELLEKQSDLIATELTNDYERNVPKTQINLKNSSTELTPQQLNNPNVVVSVADTEIKPSEIYETKYHHKQVYQNSIISQIDFSDLLKSTDSAETKQKTHSEFENLFKNLEDDQHSNKQESESTDQDKLTHSKCDQILHSDKMKPTLSPKHHFYRFSYEKTLEIKSSSSNQISEVKPKSNEIKGNETKEIEETKIIPNELPSSMSTNSISGSTKFFSSLDESRDKEKNLGEKLDDNNKPKAIKPILTDNNQETTRTIISSKLKDNKPKTTTPKLEDKKPRTTWQGDNKTKMGWPSPLKGSNSKNIYGNILSDIDQAESSKLFTSEEIPMKPPKVISNLLEYLKDEEDPTTLRCVTPSSLDISTKSNECDFFRNDPSEKAATNKITTFTEALKSLSEEIYRKTDSSTRDISPRKVSNETEPISEKPAQLQSDTKLSFSNFFNKSPPKIKEADPKIISDNAELLTQKDVQDVQVSISKNPESIIDKKPVIEPSSASSIPPKIVKIEKVTKPPLKVLQSTESTEVCKPVVNKFQSKPTTILKPTISATISKKQIEPSKSELSKTQSMPTSVTSVSQTKSILTLKTTGCKVQEPTKFITALKVSVSQPQLQTVSTTTSNSSESITISQSKPGASALTGPRPGSGGLSLTALGQSLRLIKDGDEYRLISIPIATSGTAFTMNKPPTTVTPCINPIQTMITEAIRKRQEATAAQKTIQNQEIQSKTIVSPTTETRAPNTTTLPLKSELDVKLKSILKTPINVNKDLKKSTQTVFATKVLSTPTNVIKPGTSVSVNNRPMTVKSILVAPANILKTKGNQSTKLGNITVLKTASVAASSASITKPTGIPVKSIPLTDNKKMSILKKSGGTKPVVINSAGKPLQTTFTNSLKIAKESETIKQVPKSNKLLNITSKKSSDPIINITESDDDIEILAITNEESNPKSSPRVNVPPTTFANILKNQTIKPEMLKKRDSPPSPMSIEYENHEGVKQTVLVHTNKSFGSDEQIQSLSFDSQSSSSNESNFTIMRTSNGYLEVKSTAKPNLHVEKAFKIEYINRNNDVPDLVPISSNSKRTELGKHKLMSENQTSCLGSKRLKNINEQNEGCSGTTDSQHHFQESTGGVQQSNNPNNSPNPSTASNRNSPSTNHVHVSVQQQQQTTTTVPTLSTIVTTPTPNIVQNSLNTTNGSTVSVVRSTSAIITNSTTLSSSNNTDTPTLVNMLIHRPTIRTNHQEMTAATATRLKQQLYQQSTVVHQADESTVQQQQGTMSTVTVNSTPVSVSNIIRATGVTGVNQSISTGTTGTGVPAGTIQVRGIPIPATSGTTSGTPHLLSFVNSSQLLKSISASDGVKPLQLLYKISDGKTYITPVSLSASSSVKMATQLVNKQQHTQHTAGEIVKVEVISPTSHKLTPAQVHTTNSAAQSTARSVFEETYAKFIHIGRTNQTQTQQVNNNNNNNNSTSSVSAPTSTSSESITITSSAATVQLSTLPKFQQAFGKTTNFSNSQTTRDTDHQQQQQQPLLLVSKMGGASVVSVSSAPPSLPVTSTITSTTSTPITVVPVSVSVSSVIGNTIATSTIQRAINNCNQQVRLIKATNNIATASTTNTTNKAIIDNKNESNDVDSNASNDSLPPSSVSASVSQTVSLLASQSSGSIQSQGNHSHSQTVLTPMRLALPIVQRTGAGGIPTTRVVTPVLLRQRVLLTSGAVGTPIRLPQNARVLTSNMNTLEPSVSSSTLEQLREFDKVFEKVKERSTTSTGQPATVGCVPSVTSVTTITVPSTTISTVVSTSCFVSKSQLDNSNTTADTSDDSTQTSNRSSTPIMATFQTAPHIDTSNLVVGSQQQRVSVAYVSGQLGQTILSSPVVVMQQQPMSMSMASSTPSPALSVTSQSSSSSPSSSSNANNNPISSSKPTSTIKLNATVNSQQTVSGGSQLVGQSVASKTIKNKPIKPNTQASPLKASPVPKPQQKPQEDEGTAQRIYSILAEYAEQLRNSPDLNNKPAPRRRSNPPANPSQNSKRKKSSGGKKVSTSGGGTGSGMEMSPGTIDDHRTIGSEDSSCGVQLHLSQLQDSPSQAMLSMDDAQSTEGSMDIPGMRGLHGMDNSNDCMDRPSSSQSASAVPVGTSISVPTNVSVSSAPHQTPQQTHRQLILTDTSNSTGNRNVIITDSVVSEALAQVGKITNTATVLVPGNYLLPMSMVKGGHQITIVSGGSKILAVKPLKLPTTLSNNAGGAGTSQQITTQVLVPTSNAQKLSTQILNRTMVSSSETSLIRTSQSANAAGILTVNTDSVTTRDHSSSNSLDFNSSGAVLTVQSSNSKSHSTLVETSTNSSHRNTTHVHQLQLQVNDPTTISGSNGPLLSQLCNELNDTGNHHSSGMILTDHANATNIINVSPIHNVNGKVERDCISIDNSKNSFKKSTWSSNNSDSLSDQHQHHQTGASPIFRHSPGMQYATSTVGCDTQADKKSRSINNNNQKQLSIQAQRKQAAIERELRLQKSLSEECEDLGVDEPSASDLFPEAEILFDNTNQSPSFGVGANVLLQDVVTTTCSNDNDHDNDDENINIFTNTLDNGSSRDLSLTMSMSMSMTTASSQEIKSKLNEHIDYLLVQKNKINKNGTTKFHANVVAQCSNSSQSSYEDTNTLITNTPLISDVTIPSPLPQSTSYCLPSPYRAESPLTQATHSHLYTYSKKSNTKLTAKKGRSYSLFESDCELSSSSHDDTNSRTSSTSNDVKDNDSLSDSASEAQSDNNTRKYSRKRPYKLYVYDENGVDASSFTCDKDETHETSAHLNNTPSSDNNEESMSAMSADMMEGMLEDSSESSPHSILSDSDLASISSGLRRSSKRGHVRKGCPCCTTAQDTSSPPTKRKFGKKAFTQHGHAATKKIGGKKIS